MWVYKRDKPTKHTLVIKYKETDLKHFFAYMSLYHLLKMKANLYDRKMPV